MSPYLLPKWLHIYFPRQEAREDVWHSPINFILHNIHYANIKEGQGGTVRGLVSHFTYLRLAVSPSVSLSRLVRIPDRGTALVIPYLCASDALAQLHQNTPQFLTGCGIQPNSIRNITVPAFTLKTAKNASKCSNSPKSLKNGLFLAFQVCSRGPCLRKYGQKTPERRTELFQKTL